MMRFKLCAKLDAAVHRPDSDPLARAIRGDDAEALAGLMLDAYRGTIDDGGESIDDARSEIRRLFDGNYGELDLAASEVIERQGVIVSATIVTTYEGAPMIAFSMTAPGWKRRGLARAGLVRAMSRLRDAGAARVFLAVTSGNVPAEALYASLGFERAP
jgi:ribosomal protein S18 acetylase RimI-like enzyme